MSCCAPGAEAIAATATDEQRAEEIRLASRPLGNGLMQTSLAVPDLHCGACLRTVETALGRLDGVELARANLSARRVTVQWRADGEVPQIAQALERAGYAAHLNDPDRADGDEALKRLIRAIAVAGFAAANIMLLSVSVWSGADAATRDLFHWISALIALPAVAYSGRIFFGSAWQALRARSLNMDVPIALAILLAFAMSLYETANHGEHAYFDAATTLMFFLLIGRALDHVMREKARSAVTGLARMSARGAVVLRDDGSRDYVGISDVRPGMRIIVAAGERIPVDGRVETGRSEIDCSIVTGESAPEAIAPGGAVRAGTLNLTGAVTMVAEATADDSFLAEMRRLMEAAEGGRARYRRIADRAAEIYAPAVHLAAAASFLAWYAISGDLHHSVYTAIAVLIITCPCALGLAVPVVQVVAARRLFESGIMVKDGAALERIAECDHVVFDKTGTLTADRVALADRGDIDADAMALAAAMASQSRHPYSRAIAAAAEGGEGRVGDVTEHPGFGLEAREGENLIRLGRPDWALDDATGIDDPVVLSSNGRLVAGFDFTSVPRADAGAAIAALRQMGLEAEILSGDRPATVRALAETLGVARFAGGVLPDGKLERLAVLGGEGHKALMVGDGINDAPALAAAHASMAPAGAADIGRQAAGFVFLRDSLMAVPLAVRTARNASRLVRQNFALAIAYNIVAVPAAALGYVTPLVAALAMSASSIVVIANALRLNSGAKASPAGKTADTGPAISPPAGVPAE
ncbi:MAG: heavy metal translocating P-type ATPase [Rhizobiaceae bacterium]